ncbi:MAG: ATP-binding protein, partial [Myxococcota bacterium]|nr:ATP-binding protein [Myxococcota bacterium]
MPNAPATFVGRDDELERLRRVLERGAFAAIVGPGGIGKTALVLETIARCFPDAIDRAFFFAVPRDEPLEQLCRTLLYALAAHVGREDELDLVAVQTDLSLCLETLFELAAETSPWIVLDDVHHVIDGDAEDLLLPFAAYARDAKLVVTTRRPLQAADLAERSVALGRLSEGELLGLARALDPRLAEHRSHGLVAAAGGSPWVLKQVLARGIDEAVSDSRRELLGGLREPELAFVESLAWLRSEVPVDVLSLLTTERETIELEPLIARGLVTITPDGARIHDVVLDLLGSDFDAPARRARACELRGRLAASQQP